LILSKAASLVRILILFLFRPRPISIEQTLRDIIPELFLINNILYGGEKEDIDHIFEVLECYVKRFTTTHDERVNIVSSILQACARTIAGGDSYFVVRSLLGNPNTLIRPSDTRGAPIIIEISPTNPSECCITLMSAFSFHTIEDVDSYDGTADDEPEPILRVQTFHVQEIDFVSGKSSRHLKIRDESIKEKDVNSDHSNSYSSGGNGGCNTGRRDLSFSGYGALLDGLS